MGPKLLPEPSWGKVTCRVNFTDPEDEEIEERKFVTIEITVVAIPNDAHPDVKGLKPIFLVEAIGQLVPYKSLSSGANGSYLDEYSSF